MKLSLPFHTPGSSKKKQMMMAGCSINVIEERENAIILSFLRAVVSTSVVAILPPGCPQPVSRASLLVLSSSSFLSSVLVHCLLMAGCLEVVVAEFLCQHSKGLSDPVLALEVVLPSHLRWDTEKWTLQCRYLDLLIGALELVAACLARRERRVSQPILRPPGQRASSSVLAGSHHAAAQPALVDRIEYGEAIASMTL